MNIPVLMLRAVVRSMSMEASAEIGAEKKRIRPTAAAATQIAVPKHENLAIKVEGKMRRLRSYYDADRADPSTAPTNYRTGQNQNELYCSLCGEAFYVDDLIFDQVVRLVEKTMENPFLCAECLEEYEELAHRH